MLVFVVGIYKSGTSVITSKLEEMGIPSVVEDFRFESNVQGVKYNYNIRESYEVNCLNNDIIYSSGQNEMYFDTQKMPPDVDGSLSQRIRDFYARIGNKGVIKDPRFIGTLQYWIKEIPEGIDYKIVWVGRNNVEEIEASFKKDKWFVGKVKEEIGYKDTINKLIFNLLHQYNKFKDKTGIAINYETYLKYPEEYYMLLYNYINSNREYFVIKKIYFAEYYKPSKELTQLFACQCPFNISVWENIMAVDSQEEADYIIIQDKTQEQIVDESRVIFFGREPKHVPGAFRDGKPEYFKTLHHERGETWMPQTWWIDNSFNAFINTSPEKTKNLSIIDSGKNTVPGGHSFRLNLIKKIEELYPGEMDIWGKINGKILPERDKSLGLADYKYYLAIENGKTDHYFSEKIVDALLCECMPIYWGCNKLEEYFPEGSFVRIDDTKPIEEIAKQVIEISKSDLRDKNIDKIREAKNLILYKYNIWPTIAKVINEN